MGFGSELLFVVALGLLLLGPKRLNLVLRQLARVKAELLEASRNFKSQITTELEASHSNHAGDGSNETSGDQ